MSNFYKKVIFPIHIFQTNIRENVLIQDDILSLIESFYKKHKLNVPNGWLTDNLFTTFDRREVNHYLFHNNSRVIEWYTEYITKFFDKQVEFEIDDIWLNVYANGEYQEEHTHLTPDIFIPRSHFSCIHYLQFDSEKHVPVTFVDPIDTLRYNTLEMESNQYTDRWSPKVNEGDLLMFPTYLKHFVEKSNPTPDKPRISVVFNIRILRYGDKLHEGN